LKKSLSLNYKYNLWGITAPAEVRFKRLKLRKRTGDIETLEQFQKVEAAEFANPDPNGQQLSALYLMADNILINNDSLSKFQDILATAYNLLLSK